MGYAAERKTRQRRGCLDLRVHADAETADVIAFAVVLDDVRDGDWLAAACGIGFEDAAF